MSTLGFYQDAPYKIETEGREITLKLQKISPTTAKVVWTLPKGAPGCSIEDLEYNGIVLVADTVPIKNEQTPKNHKYYTGDPTVNRNLHAGDKIGTGLVIGAFYDDKTTTSIEISGLEPNTPYYIAGFAVNNVGVYHYEGVHSYSQNYQEKGDDPDTPACQQVQLGVRSTDTTGLNPSKTYTFKITINGTEYPISVNGAQAQTYQELINTLNHILATIDNPFQGINPPNFGTIYVNQTTNEVFVWDGSTHIPKDSIVNTTPPTSPSVGDFWVDADNLILHRWNGASWIPQQVIKFESNPINPKCGTYWFNGNTAFLWDGLIWKPVPTFVQSTNPANSPILPCGKFWLDLTTNSMYRWEAKNASCSNGELTEGQWTQVDVLVWNDDPRLIEDDYFWFNTSTKQLKIRNAGSWNNVGVSVVKSLTVPSSNYAVGTLWYNPEQESLFEWDGVAWVEIFNLVVWHKDPTIPTAGDLYLNGYSDDLFVWDVVGQQWKLVPDYYESQTNPAVSISLEKSSIWVNGNIVKEWDGMQWINTSSIIYEHDPTLIADGSFWYDTTNDKWNVLNAGAWVPLTYIKHATSPSAVNIGQYWYNPSAFSLSMWNGIAWIPLMFQTTPVSNSVGLLWYNTTNSLLYEWDGNKWNTKPTTFVSLDESGHLLFKTGTTGSSSTINVVDGLIPTGLFVSLTPAGRIQPPQKGTDGLLPTPSYLQLGVGTDGTSEERREMVEAILLQLGYPTVQVELTKQQLEFCIDQGIQTLRRMGSAGYERVFFFLDLKAGQQHYKLTDQTVGFHKIVNIMGIYRATSAFLGTAEGQGVYGQLVLQHLYQMGTFDLVSYHVINEYIELMEKLFAANIMYSWKEKTRQLSIHQNLWRDERVLVDAMIERTEQDILADRFLNNWIQMWATAEACMILAEIRGKFSTLPGAGGGVTLNAGDLRARAERGFQTCIEELDNYIANSNIESLGLNTQLIIG